MDSKYTIFWLLVPLLLGGVLFLAGSNTPDMVSKDQYQELGYFELPEPRALNFELLNQRGETVDANHWMGKTTIVFFGFARCPDVCPTTLSVLNLALQASDVNPRVVLVSVDPEHDTPALLGPYVTAFNEQFEAYTGTLRQITAFTRQLDTRFHKVVDPDTGSWTVDHSANLMVINKRGEYQGLVRPPFDVSNLATLLALLER